MSGIKPRPATPGQYLTFFVGGGEYAVPVIEVREVVEATSILRVPSAPPAVRGLMSLRGGVVPVIDVGVRLGLEERRITQWACVVIVWVEIGGEPTAIGLLVDAVSQVIDLAPGTIEPVPPFVAPVRADLLRGIGLIDSAFMLILDVSRVLSLSDFVATTALSAADGEAAGDVSAPPAASSIGDEVTLCE